MLEWDKAANLFEKLANNNYWSKAFYVFAQATCNCIFFIVQMFLVALTVEDISGNKEKGIELYKTVPTLVVRKYGGRILGVEQYVLRKVKMYTELYVFFKGREQKENYDSLFLCFTRNFELGNLPALELIYIWNGFYCMPFSLLEKCLVFADEDLSHLQTISSEGGCDEEDATIPYLEDRRAMLRLIKSAIWQNLGKEKYKEAFDTLNSVCECELNSDTFINPFAYLSFIILYVYLLILIDIMNWACSITSATIRKTLKRHSEKRENSRSITLNIDSALDYI